MDMQRYTRTLVEGETNLSQLLEEALVKNQKEDEAAKAEEFEDDSDLFNDDPVSSVEQELENQDEYNLFMDNDIFDDDTLFADVKDDELWP